jgi:hypothetical protein
MDSREAIRTRFLARWAELRGPQQSAVDQAADRAVVTGARRVIAELRFFGVEARLVNGTLMLFGPTHKVDAARVLEVLAGALTIDPTLVALEKPEDGQETMPDGCSPKAWARAVVGQRRFVEEGWADKARACGWSDTGLFALPPLWSRLDLTGCAWLIGERRILSVTAETIAIEPSGGAQLTFYRKNSAYVWDQPPRRNR